MGLSEKYLSKHKEDPFYHKLIVALELQGYPIKKSNKIIKDHFTYLKKYEILKPLQICNEILKLEKMQKSKNF